MKYLSTKFLIMILSVILIGTSMLTVVGIILFRRYLMEECMSTLSRTTSLEAERINGWLENHIYFVEAIANELYFVEDYSRANLFPRLSKHLSETEYSDVYIGFPDGTIIMGTGYIPDYTQYRTNNRPWYENAVSDINTVHISEPYLEIESNEFCVAVTKAIVKNDEVIAVVGVDVNLNTLWDILQKVNLSQNSYTFLDNGLGYILYHPDASYVLDENGDFRHYAEIESGIFSKVQEDTIAGQTVSIKNADEIVRFYSAEVIPLTGWRIYTAIAANEVLLPLYQLIIIFICVSILWSILASVFAVKKIQEMIIQPIRQVTKSADILSRGGTNISLQHNRKDEFGILMDSFTQMAYSIDAQTLATEKIATGNLNFNVAVRSKEDIMGKSINSLIDSLNKIVKEIMNVSLQVSSSSREISQSMQNLSRGAIEQSTSVQDIKEFMTDIGEILSINDKKNIKAVDAGANVRITAAESSEQIRRLFIAVGEITESSNSISNVVKLIEFIAYKTNILSINAAIEAAHAGDAGKGFSVVAAEIQQLAFQCTEAVKQTSALIDNTISSAQESVKIAEQTEYSMDKIMATISNATNLINEFGAHSKKQGQAIRQLADAIEQINDVIASNASSAQQCAVASEALNMEADRLMNIVQQFRTK